METSTAQTSLGLVTAPASPLASRPATPEHTDTQNNVDEIISQSDKEPVLASNYGKTETSNCLEDKRPQRTKSPD